MTDDYIDNRSDDDILAEAKARFASAEEWWASNRKSYLEDIKFRALDQWPEKIKNDREKSFRPCLVLDKTNQYVRQVVNDGRQNRPGVKVHPVDDNGDEKVAEGYQGIIRRICRQSSADEAFDTALDCAAAGGYGFFRIITDYLHENTFDQEIDILRVRNPRTILLDPNFQAADGSDTRWGFVISELTKEEYKAQYPKAKYTDWQTDLPKYSDAWLPEGNVRVVEYFYAVDIPGDLHKLADGTSIRDDEYQNAVKELGAQNVPKILETRSVPLTRVRWCRLSGAEVLEKNKWLGKYIPLIPVFGNEFDIDGKVVYSGLIRGAKDAQRLYNYARSAYVETVALAPKAPIQAPAEAVANHPEWQSANTENYSLLQWDHKDADGDPIPPPSRIQPATQPTGWAQDMQMSEHDIQASMGMYQATLGQPSNEKSGRAILARQHQGDTATFHYQDNLNRAIRNLGRQLVDLIPKVYDSKRVVRTLGEDGTAGAMQVNPAQQVPVQTFAGQEIYNLNAGIYDVSVEAGPSYNTKRQEAADAQLQLAQAVPQLWQLGGDIMIRNLDWPGADELADRWKLMLPPPILQAEQGQQPLPPEIQQAMQQVQQGQQQLQMAHQQLQEMAQQVQQDKAATDAQRVKLEALQTKLDAADKILQANYQEYSAKLELEAMKTAQTLQPQMPPGKDEPAINPNSPAPAGLSVSGD